MIFEKMFENRLFFVDKLVGLGARIILCDPHRVVVTGPAQLYGERMSSPDIRAGMAMLLAALCAEGTSTIGNVREIDRGYERIDERLRALGALDRARRRLGTRAGAVARRDRDASAAPTSPAVVPDASSAATVNEYGVPALEREPSCSSAVGSRRAPVAGRARIAC